MCTLIAAVQHWPDSPLVVAANRDEAFDRPAVGPRMLRYDPIPVLAPSDLRAGGTWLGINAKGVFAALTNRAGVSPDPERLSRGHVPLLALTASTAAEGAGLVANIDPAGVNPFHLLVADCNAAHLVWHDGVDLRHEVLAPGLYVFSERSLGAGVSGREKSLRDAMKLWGKSHSPSDETLYELLGQHNEEQPLDGVCVHTPFYGTRSSALIRLHQHMNKSRFVYGDGPSCKPQISDVSFELQSLSAWDISQFAAR